MSKAFEELARQSTPMGEISLRRRLEPSLLVDVYEVKLGDEFLMTSLFTAGEVALAELGLAATEGDELDVVIGGLGLGYTARAAINDPRVRSLQVIDALGEVIDWHHQGLIPHSAELTDDPRCQLVHGDFFAMITDGLQPTPRARHDSTRSSSTSTTLRSTCCTHVTPASTNLTGCSGSPTSCIPVACSGCGLMIRPTTTSSPISTSCSPVPTHTS